MLRLFWCVVITLIPLSILFTGASLDTMKTTVILTALPFLLVLLVKTYGFARWLKQDYAAIPAHLIESSAPALPRRRRPPNSLLHRRINRALWRNDNKKRGRLTYEHSDPEFTLPKDFCADAREAYTIPARFYTHRAAFEHEKSRCSPPAGFAWRTAASLPNRTTTSPARSSVKTFWWCVAATTCCAPLQRLPAPRPPAAGGRRPGENVITCPYHARAFAGRRTGARAQLRKRAELR